MRAFLGDRGARDARSKQAGRHVLTWAGKTVIFHLDSSSVPFPPSSPRVSLALLPLPRLPDCPSTRWLPPSPVSSHLLLLQPLSLSFGSCLSLSPSLALITRCLRILPHQRELRRQPMKAAFLGTACVCARTSVGAEGAREHVFPSFFHAHTHTPPES